MSLTQQTPNQTILEHGQSVWAHTKKLILSEFESFKLPEWFLINHHFIVNNLHDWETIGLYNLNHDCGKAYCRVVDTEGKQHFPNHSEVSEEIFSQIYPDKPLVAELIGLDMVLHTETCEQVFARNLSIKTLTTLLVTAFAEIHANAEMFGGLESTSFKIKWKKLDRIGKRIVEKIEKHAETYSYIFIRKDLTNSQRIVQSSHAVFEAAKWESKHPSLIALGVNNEVKLKAVMKYLLENEIQFKIFREPLFNNEITALVTEQLSGERRNLLKKYQLIKD